MHHYIMFNTHTHILFIGIKLQVLKMYAWEPSFSEKVGKIRNQELKCVEKMAWLNGIVGVTWFCTPYLVRENIILINVV